MTSNDNRLTVYYDGSCSVCTDEIDRYRRLDTAGKLHLVDISAPSFVSPVDGELDCNAHVHVFDRIRGKMSGIDAITFIRQEIEPSPFEGLRQLFRSTGDEEFPPGFLRRVRRILPFNRPNI